jgi:uncharacterized protein YpiB (UPF0302 family)
MNFPLLQAIARALKETDEERNERIVRNLDKVDELRLIQLIDGYMNG